MAINSSRFLQIIVLQIIVFANFSSKDWRSIKEFFKKIYLFSLFLAMMGLLAARRLPLVVASGGFSLLSCVGFSLWWLLSLWSSGSGCTDFSSCNTCLGSVVGAHRLSCSAACGIFPDQGLNWCPLHCKADS